MSALDLTGSPTLTVSQGGQSAETSGTAMHFSGNVVLYVTKLSGHLLGIPLTLTPGSPLTLFTSLLNGVPLTGVTTDQPLISADSLSIPGLQVNVVRTAAATPGWRAGRCCRPGSTRSSVRALLKPARPR